MRPDEDDSRKNITISLPISGFASTSGKSAAAPVPLEMVFSHYLCQICSKTAKEPILNVLCGHLFCWRCIYKFSNTSKFGEQCPVCSSHMDISISNHNSTIISVYSGPKPGIYYNPWLEREPEQDEEHVKKLEEEARSYGDSYVPPPPMFNGGSRYGSALDLIFWAFCRLGLTVDMDVKLWLQDLIIVKSRLEKQSIVKPHSEKPYEEEEDPIEDLAYLATSDMASCMEFLQKGVEWIHGKKKENASNVPYSQNGSDLSAEKLEQDLLHFKYKSRISLLPCSSELSHSNNSFRCKICSRPAYEPVVTRCGHLFCWSCLNLKAGCNSGSSHDVVECPFCKLSIDIYDGNIIVNPIYCGGGLCPEYEDGLLIKGRRFVYKGDNRLNEILCVPRRPLPALSCMFIRCLFKEYEKENTDMKTRLAGLLDKKSSMKIEDFHHIVKDIINSIDQLNPRLKKKWNEIVSKSKDMNGIISLLEDERDT